MNYIMFAFGFTTWTVIRGFHIPPIHNGFRKTRLTRGQPFNIIATKTTPLGMGLFDSVFSNFLKERKEDFVKLEESVGEFGPGPVMLLYQIPSGIEDEEVKDILDDMAPTASKKCRFVRFMGNERDFLDLTLQESLERVANGETLEKTDAMGRETTSEPVAPVLFFSGFRDDEMLAVYNVVVEEVYKETGGKAYPACAKAVPNAMGKPLRQVLEEVTGDHADATKKV